MFSIANDKNPNDAMPCPNGGRPGELCGPALGAELIKLFGFIPEAWKTHPSVATQCPDPNNPVLVLQQAVPGDAQNRLSVLLCRTKNLRNSG